MQAQVVWRGDGQIVGTTDGGRNIAIHHADDAATPTPSKQSARPLELMLLGVGSCATLAIVDILRKGREQVTDCTAHVEAEQAATAPKVFTHVHLRFHISGHGLNPTKVERAIRLTTQKYCAASILLERAGVAISHDYELAAP